MTNRNRSNGPPDLQRSADAVRDAALDVPNTIGNVIGAAGRSVETFGDAFANAANDVRADRSGPGGLPNPGTVVNAGIRSALALPKAILNGIGNVGGAAVGGASGILSNVERIGR